MSESQNTTLNHTKNSFTPKHNCRSCKSKFQSAGLPASTRFQERLKKNPESKPQPTNHFLPRKKSTSRVGLKIILHAVTFQGILRLSCNLVQITRILQENCTFFLKQSNRRRSFKSKKKWHKTLKLSFFKFQQGQKVT